jgi:hypothetical protein
MAYLRELTYAGAARRYGPRGPDTQTAYTVLEHELGIIDQLGFPGYFLVVWELVEFCHRNGIMCQGRGSAANSAVCYALGVTAVDAVRYGLLFERFLSPERDGPPDIDIDIESDRREEVIQHVYAMHGRESAAQVANVIILWNLTCQAAMAASVTASVRSDPPFVTHGHSPANRQGARSAVTRGWMVPDGSPRASIRPLDNARSSA